MRLTKKLMIIFCLAATLAGGCQSSSPRLVEKLLAPDPAAPIDHWVKTSDNWSLHLLHYPPVKHNPKRVPIVLCHGLSHNNTYWDLADNVSLARYLQRRGYDVWSVSLRGAGQSTKPTLSQIRQLFRLNVSSLNPKGIVNRRPGLLRMNWTVDDHINRDIPAILDYVTGQTGYGQVVWVGHSMGAMIMFAWLGMHPDAPVQSFVAIAGPMYLERPANDWLELLARSASITQVGNLTGGTNLRAAVGVLAGNLIKTPVDQLFLNESNVEPDLIRTFYYKNQDDISPGQLDQLLQYVKRGHFTSYDNTIDYTDNVKKIKVPTLQIAGQLDNFAEPGFMAVIHNRLGAEKKQIRMFGKINGYRADYGHDDLIIGRYARDEVYPYIESWLSSESIVSAPTPR
ncbi:MAG: alpha/beta hydrolase [Phycisphaerae bacterium]|nr:alpha/beta hydrolase [Phycisphaerae bacterium]